MDDKKKSSRVTIGDMYLRQAGEIVEMPPHKRGRESLFKPEYCEGLIEHMSYGKSFLSYGTHIGVCPKTLYNWAEAHPEFAEARDMGESASLDFWEDKGIAGMDNGKNFNAQVWIHGMRCRFRNYGWREKFPEDEGEKTTINNTVQLTPAQLADLIRVAKGDAPQVVEAERLVTPHEPKSGD